MKNKAELLVLIRKVPEGIPMGDLKDSYPVVMSDVQVHNLSYVKIGEIVRTCSWYEGRCSSNGDGWCGRTFDSF